MFLLSLSSHFKVTGGFSQPFPFVLNVGEALQINGQEPSSLCNLKIINFSFLRMRKYAYITGQVHLIFRVKPKYLYARKSCSLRYFNFFLKNHSLFDNA